MKPFRSRVTEDQAERRWPPPYIPSSNPCSSTHVAYPFPTRSTLLPATARFTALPQRGARASIALIRVSFVPCTAWYFCGVPLTSHTSRMRISRIGMPHGGQAQASMKRNWMVMWRCKMSTSQASRREAEASRCRCGGAGKRAVVFDPSASFVAVLSDSDWFVQGT